jgi:hypothetical protein
MRVWTTENRMLFCWMHHMMHQPRNKENFCKCLQAASILIKNTNGELPTLTISFYNNGMRRPCNHIKVNCTFGFQKWSVSFQSCSHQALRIKAQVLWGMTALSHSRKLLTFRRIFLPPPSEHKKSIRGQGIREPEEGGQQATSKCW